jgi:hypothetical protein
MDFIEESRFELDSDIEEAAGSFSATVKDRFRFGERNEFGDSDGGRGVGEG